mmetsp:Transcript_83734/g.260165  ORF Transcript_83734/g.260165 Transcript_83734/m.260165 type:complete len:229 (+) Transcript_83734:263-949(+)
MGSVQRMPEFDRVVPPTEASRGADSPGAGIQWAAARRRRAAGQPPAAAELCGHGAQPAECLRQLGAPAWGPPPSRAVQSAASAPAHGARGVVALAGEEATGDATVATACDESPGAWIQRAATQRLATACDESPGAWIQRAATQRRSCQMPRPSPSRLLSSAYGSVQALVSVASPLSVSASVTSTELNGSTLASPAAVTGTEASISSEEEQGSPSRRGAWRYDIRDIPH